ncbi:MAG: hypothetical protein E6H84_12685, partial [Chloroflexi bacterium]
MSSSTSTTLRHGHGKASTAGSASGSLVYPTARRTCESSVHGGLRCGTPARLPCRRRFDGPTRPHGGALGERVFVGMRLPLIAFVVAKQTHAPKAIGLFELGLVRDEPARELLYTMGDNANVTGAAWCGRTIDLMGMLQRGEVQAGFIGGAEIDVHGNLNTTAIGERTRPTVQLPGSGGGADIASLAERLIVIMPHDRRRLREKVDFVTSP